MSKTISSSPQATKQLAASLLSQPNLHIIALIGDLGSGKTTFTQGLGEALGLSRLLSPTYTLIRQYPLTNSKFDTLYHIDLYRIHDQDEALMLGLREILDNDKNLVVVEWPEKIQSLLPNHLRISFEKLDNNDRQITIEEKS